MDSLKAELAAQIRNYLLTIHTVGDLHTEEVSVQIVSDLQTQLRVKTAQGPRYFLVKVAEQY